MSTSQVHNALADRFPMKRTMVCLFAAGSPLLKLQGSMDRLYGCEAPCVCQTREHMGRSLHFGFDLSYNICCLSSFDFAIESQFFCTRTQDLPLPGSLIGEPP